VTATCAICASLGAAAAAGVAAAVSVAPAVSVVAESLLEQEATRTTAAIADARVVSRDIRDMDDMVVGSPESKDENEEACSSATA
jgi:hypothetical protein